LKGTSTARVGKSNKYASHLEKKSSSKFGRPTNTAVSDHYMKALIVVHKEILMPLRNSTGCVDRYKVNCGVGPDLFFRVQAGANIRDWYNLAGLQLFTRWNNGDAWMQAGFRDIQSGARAVALLARNDRNDEIDGRK
jgi:hypothetical protein